MTRPSPIAALFLSTPACQCGEPIVHAKAELVAEPASLDSGSTSPGTPVVRQVTLTNLGTATATLAGITLGGQVPGGRVCDGTECDGTGHWWERILDEQECAQAGLMLTTRGEEGREMKAAFASAYDAMPPSWRGGPNALLMTSRFGDVRSLRFEPKGDGSLPTVIFLHGFGGLLTPYVSLLARQLGDGFIIVAPALDNVGVWSSRRGQQVLRATLASLPARADRSKVFLVGLSNGGVGATTALCDPELRTAFAGFVLLSGVGRLPSGAQLEGARVLVVTGRDDPRFPLSYVVAQPQTLRGAGADVDALSLPATHALVFTHAAEWVETFERWSLAKQE